MEFGRYVTTIDAHVGGQPVRMITGGLPFLRGKSLEEKLEDFHKNCEGLRRLLMHEPRGYADMTGCMLVEPERAEADFGLLFMHNEGLQPMNGQGIVAAATIAIETGLVNRSGSEIRLDIDTIAGPITALAQCRGESVTSVSICNIPALLIKRDVPVTVREFHLMIDFAYSGNLFALVKAGDLRLSIDIHHRFELKKRGMEIKRALTKLDLTNFPLGSGSLELEGVLFYETVPVDQQLCYKNIVVFADGYLDRSACLMGSSARMALLQARGELSVGEELIQEGIAGGRIAGKISRTARLHSHEACITELTARAFITGTHQFVVDPSDPLSGGFLLQ